MSCGRPMRNRLFPAAAAALFLTALAVPAAHAKGGDAPVTEAELAGHIRILASDAFEGRAPGTGGEDRTIAYIVGEWAKAGLEPRSEEHTSELQSLMRISYAVFCLKKKKNDKRTEQHVNS